MIVNMLKMVNPRPYFRDTVRSLDRSDFWGCLAFFETPFAFQRFAPPSRENFTENYIRALRYGDPSKDVVVCEDDVVFAVDWHSRLVRALAQIHTDRVMVALYSAPCVGVRTQELAGVSRYPGKHFQGTQAVYYSQAVRPELADWLEGHLEQPPGDHRIAEWAEANDCLYRMHPSVVQHIGVVSTGIGREFHRSSNFCGGG